MSSVTLISYDIPSVSALVDSRSSNCFIDTIFINEHAISSYPVPPLQLQLFDRTTNSTIIQAIDLFVHFQIFYITLLEGSCSLVLGHNWLTCYNPLIDWISENTLFHSSEQNISAASRLISFGYSYIIQYTTKFLPMQGSTHYDYQCPCFCIGLSS